MATTRELIDQLRIDIDDLATPYFCSDSELVGYLNRAVDEACLRSRLIRDSDTPDVCQISLRPTYPKYRLDSRLLSVQRAIVSGQARAMTQTNYDVLDRDCPGWGTDTADVPTHFILDLDACWLRVFPTPTLAGQITMTVWRTQLEDLDVTNSPNDQPEIGRIHHYNLLDYAKHLAYSKHDSEMFDPEAATSAAIAFSANFGRRRNAATLELIRHDKNLKVRSPFV